MKIFVIGAIQIEKQMFVDQMPTQGELSTISQYNETYSSKTLNSARIFSIYHEVSYLGFVGRTEFEKCKAFLEENEISTEFLNKSDKKTGEINVYVDKQGQNAFSIYHGANADLQKVTETDLKKMLNGYDVIYTYTNIPEDLMKKLIKLKKNLEIKLILDTPKGDSRKLDLIQKADYISPNRTELSQILKEDITIANLEKTIGKHDINQNMLVTLDEEGAVYYDSDLKNFYKSPVLKAQKSVDTTGAGDIFRAIFYSNLLDGKDPESSLQEATKIASMSVEIKGLEKTLFYVRDLLLRQLQEDNI